MKSSHWLVPQMDGLSSLSVFGLGVQRAWRQSCFRPTMASPDAGINALVYELYGLTEEEIAIVERRDH